MKQWGFCCFLLFILKETGEATLYNGNTRKNISDENNYNIRVNQRQKKRMMTASTLFPSPSSNKSYSSLSPPQSTSFFYYDNYENTAPVTLFNGSIQFNNGWIWSIYDAETNIVPEISYDVKRGGTRSLTSSTGSEIILPTPSNHTVEIDNDVIVLYTANHYFHFIYESFPVIMSLQLHQIFQAYPNATYLTYCRHLDEPVARMVLNFFNMSNLWVNRTSDLATKVKCFAPPTSPSSQQLIRYQVIGNHKLIVPKKLGAFANRSPYMFKYIRSQLQINHHNPTRQIYLSRGKDRRSVENEEQLIAALKALLPNLEVYYPGILPIEEQYRIFHDADLIIGPHGNAFTNLIFAPNTTTLIEFIPPKMGDYRLIYQVLGFSLGHYCSIHVNTTDPQDARSNIVVKLPQILPQIKYCLKMKYKPQLFSSL